MTEGDTISKLNNSLLRARLNKILICIHWMTPPYLIFQFLYLMGRSFEEARIFFKHEIWLFCTNILLVRRKNTYIILLFIERSWGWYKNTKSIYATYYLEAWNWLETNFGASFWIKFKTIMINIQIWSVATNFIFDHKCFEIKQYKLGSWVLGPPLGSWVLGPPLGSRVLGPPLGSWVLGPPLGSWVLL